MFLFFKYIYIYTSTENLITLDKNPYTMVNLEENLNVELKNVLYLYKSLKISESDKIK
jgi:hypothetical protein